MKRIAIATLTAVLMYQTPARAADSIVFISAFASGEDAGIHAFHFDGKSGTLKPLQRTADVAHPFFLAISPDKRFLYSIDAPEFGGKEDEFVAAYAMCSIPSGMLTQECMRVP